MNQKQTEVVQTVWLYSTVQQFVQRHPAFTVGGLRHLIFNEKTNGFASAFKRVGKKVLVDEQEFFRIIEIKNQGGK